MHLPLRQSEQRLSQRATISIGCIALFGLLLAEGLFLSWRFDLASIRGETGWWAEVLRQARFLPQIGIGLAVAMFLFGGTGWREIACQASRETMHLGWMAGFLIAHWIALAATVWLTDRLLQRTDRNAETATLAWLALGLLTIGLWAGAAVPPRIWPIILRRGTIPLLLGTAVAVLAIEAGRFTELFWEPLGRGTLWIVYGGLRLVGAVAWFNPDAFQIGTAHFRVEIAKQCSGYEGIGLIWVFLAFYLWFFRHDLRFPQALLLFPLGTFVMWLANAARILALIGVGHVAPEVAHAGFHSHAGWIAFNGVALGLILVSRRSAFFMREETRTDSRQWIYPAAPFLAPLLATLVTGLFTSALTVTVNWGYPLGVVAAAVTLWCYRGHYKGWSWQLSPVAVGIGVAAFLLWIGIAAVGDAAAQTALRQSISSITAGSTRWAVAWLGFRIVGSVVIAPLAEELAFRGYLLRRLQATDFQEVPWGRLTAISLIVSSLLFGLLHRAWLAGSLVGLLYAFAIHRRGKLSDAIVAHAVTNGLLTVYVLATSQWWLWS